MGGMEDVLAPAAVRSLLLAIARADASAIPPRPGAVALCEGRAVARRTLGGALHLRCFRAAHGASPAYETIQAALVALVGAPPPCPACGGRGWWPVPGRAAQEAAWAALAFGAFRGIAFAPFGSDPDDIDAAGGRRAPVALGGLLDALGGCGCGDGR
jgi:hypothetical protein